MNSNVPATRNVFLSSNDVTHSKTVLMVQMNFIAMVCSSLVLSVPVITTSIAVFLGSVSPKIGDVMVSLTVRTAPMNVIVRQPRVCLRSELVTEATSASIRGKCVTARKIVMMGLTRAHVRRWRKPKNVIPKSTSDAHQLR